MFAFFLLQAIKMGPSHWVSALATLLFVICISNQQGKSSSQYPPYPVQPNFKSRSSCVFIVSKCVLLCPRR